MKKLFAVLMIAGLFGFASCGGAENATEQAATSVDSVAAAASTEAAATTEQSTAAADTAAAMPADTTMK